MLKRLTLPFTCVSTNVDETPQPSESPLALAKRLAESKAQAAAALHPHAIIIGADQVAASDNLCLGKPEGFEQAVAQLRLLSGQTATFHSAITVISRHGMHTTSVPTQCTFRELTEDEIVYYLQHDKPFDTAGSAKA